MMSIMLAGCGESSATQPSGVTENVTEEANVASESDTKSDTKETDSSAKEDKAEETSDSLPKEDVEESVREILNEIDCYKYNIFLDGYYTELHDVGTNAEISLTKKEMTRIAGVAASVPKGEFIDIDPEAWVGAEPINKEDVNKSCNDLFGTNCDCTLLDVYDSDNTNGPAWVEGELLNVYYYGETDTDIITKNTSVDIGDDEIMATEDVYVGHWSRSEGEANYKMSYYFTPNDKSKYGIILSRILIERTFDEWASYREDQCADADNDEPKMTDGFFGIWIGATKSEADAEKIISEASYKGINAQKYLSSDWSELNADPYYVVSAGTYTSEEDANSNLADVKNQGYKSAYVKYSGDYIGE